MTKIRKVDLFSDQLLDHMRQYFRQYGFGNYLDKPPLSWTNKRPLTWAIQSAGVDVGYCWIDQKQDGHYVSIAVYSEYGRQGHADRALSMVEDQARIADSISALFAQVNTNCEIGLMVRYWLFHRGYKPIRVESGISSVRRENRGGMTDMEYLAQEAVPVVMKKHL